MKLRRLELDRFTAFEQAVFEFAPGVNVIISENGTGKSHVLKLIYSLSESIRRHATGEGLDTTLRKPELDEILAEMLASVFQPDELGHLVRRGTGGHEARIRAVWFDGTTERHLEATLSNRGRVGLPRRCAVTALPIDGIRFEFDDSWVIAKWDDSTWYRERIERLKGTLDDKYESTKAVDVVGMRDDVPYLLGAALLRRDSPRTKTIT